MQVPLPLKAVKVVVAAVDLAEAEVVVSEEETEAVIEAVVVEEEVAEVEVASEEEVKMVNGHLLPSWVDLSR